MANAGAFIKKKFPKFLLVLVFTELWERYSYYAMSGIMTLYMVNEMGLNDAPSIRITSLMTALGHLLPILSGFLADRFFGFKNMMIVGAFIITGGHFMLALAAFSDIFYYWGISAISIGTGLFKGNITNLLGSCYDHLPPDLDRVSGLTLFYAGINLGGFVSLLSSPYIAEFISYHLAFSLAGFGMIIGIIIFHTNRHIYDDKDTIRNPNLLKKKLLGPFGWLSAVFLISCILTIPIGFMYYFSDFMEKINILLWMSILVIILILAIFFTLKNTRERKNFIVLIIYYFYVMAFWVPALQLTVTMVIFIDRNVNQYVGSLYIPGGSLSSISPLLIMVLGILLSTFYKHNEKLDLPRIAGGLVGNAACYFLFYVGALNADSETGLTSIWYPIISIVILSLGEIMISPLLQAITTVYAPKGRKGVMIGIYMAMLGLASLAGFIISNLFDVPRDGENDPFVSLDVYKQGFLTVAIGSSICVGIFLLLSPLTIWLRKPSAEELKKAKQYFLSTPKLKN